MGIKKFLRCIGKEEIKMFIIYKRSLNLVTLILTIVILSVFLIPQSVQGSSPSALCQTYASTAVSQQRVNLRRGCGYRGNRWQTNYNNHYNWCIRTSAQSRASETKARQDALRRCRGTSSPEVKPIEYTVGLKADKQGTKVGSIVRFRGGIRPLSENVRYRFYYGDGEKSEWLEKPAARHIYTKPGLYHVYLAVNIGEREFYSKKIPIDVSPIAYRLKFKVAPNQIIENQRTKLTATIFPSAPNAKYRFWFGDGKKTQWIRENQIDHLYTSPGRYDTSVEVRIGKKVIAKRARIEVKPIKYTVGLKADRQHIRAGEEVRFRGGIRPIGKNVRYRFYYGDGERSGWLKKPITRHIYTKPGLYHVYLVARIGERSFNSDEISIDVREIPYMLQLEANPSSTLLGEQIEFTALLEPEAPNARYQFDFSDGERTGWINKGQIEHIYASPGTYSPFIKVKIGEQIIVKETTVEVRTIEYAVGLKADRQHAQVGEKVRFKGRIKPISENVQYRFFFGDDKNSAWLNEPASDHTYANPGTYHAYLVARIGERSFNSDEISIDVREIPYMLQLEANPSSTLLGEQIEFTALLEPEAPNARYQFDFSDGEPHTQSGRLNAVHVYRTPGAYNVNVTVTIGQRSLSKTIRVTVQEQQAIVDDQWPPLWILIAAAGGILAVLGGGIYLYRRKSRKSKIEKTTEVVVTIQKKEGQTNQEIDKEFLLNGIEVRFRSLDDAGTQEIEQKDNIVDSERSDHE